MTSLNQLSLHVSLRVTDTMLHQQMLLTSDHSPVFQTIDKASESCLAEKIHLPWDATDTHSKHPNGIARLPFRSHLRKVKVWKHLCLKLVGLAFEVGCVGAVWERNGKWPFVAQANLSMGMGRMAVQTAMVSDPSFPIVISSSIFLHTPSCEDMPQLHYASARNSMKIGSSSIFLDINCRWHTAQK